MSDQQRLTGRRPPRTPCSRTTDVDCDVRTLRSREHRIAAGGGGRLHLLLHHIPMLGHLAVHDPVRTELGLPVPADVMSLVDRADGLLLATSQSFDFQADSLPDSFRCVGPLLDVPSRSKSQEANSWEAPWSGRDACPCNNWPQLRYRRFRASKNAHLIRGARSMTW